MSDLDKARDFLKRNERFYREFLGVVRAACVRVAAELGGSVVVRVYDRTDKQGGEALKDASKVADACARPVKTSNLLKVGDIVGVTIVVQYPDQIGTVLDKLAERLARERIVETRRKQHTEAYFATHATLKAPSDQQGLLCEVQCKTVLHDAWSAKMHDLTYKPLGSLDPRMRDLIEAISTSLEGLERQSQIARDMISSRHRSEREPFQTSLRAFLASVERSTASTYAHDKDSDETTTLRTEVLELSERIDEVGFQDRASDLVTRITSALGSRSRVGSVWLVAVRLASILSPIQASRFLDNAVEMIFDELEDAVEAGEISESEMRAIPIGFYALQDFGRALEYAEKLLANAERLRISTDGVNILKYNKATWLLERESLAPSKPSVAESIRREIETLLDEVRPTLSRHDEMVVRDTDGLMLIVYGTTADEIRRGMQMCVEAGVPIEGDDYETAAARAYADWRSHLGWRRYFELSET